MASQSLGAANKESRHLWVGGLPDTIDESGIKEYFSRFGKVEGVKILPQKYPKIGVAAFVDFYDVRSAVEAKDAKHKLNGQELRTNFKAKQSEKFGDNESKKTSGDEQEPSKRGSDPRSSSGMSDSDSDSGSKSSSDSHSDKESKPKKKKTGGDSNFLKITGLPRKPERVLQDGLYYEYTRYSPTVEIRMYGDDSDKWAFAKFKTFDKCQEARQETQGRNLFGSKIKVTAADIDDFPDGGRDEPLVPMSGSTRPMPLDDVDPQATRSLFVGNIPKNISVFDVRDAFQRYGNILDVEIKKMGGTATYGFVLYYDLMSAITAKKYMDGQNLKGNNIRVGFGKGTSSKQLWIDGIDSGTSRQQLERQMNKYGKVVRLGVDYPRNCAMIQYDSLDSAKKAMEAVKGTFIGSSRKLMTDFANRDARAAFFSHMERMEMVGVHQPYPNPGMYGTGMMEPGFRGGMMMTHPGMHMMSMGRGGFHPQGHGPPMDYMYDPYIEGGMSYYGGGRPPFHHGNRGRPVPIGMRPYHHGPGQFGDMNDYEEELAAYKRKRDWEKERDRRKPKKKQQTSSSDSSSDSDESSSHKKKRSSKHKHKKTTKKQKEKLKEKGRKTEDESEDDSDNEEVHDKNRLKATQKSNEHREKNKKRTQKDSSHERESDSEGESKKVKESELASKGEDSKDEELESKTNSRNSKLKSDKKGKGKAVASLSKGSVPRGSSSPPSSVQSAEKEGTSKRHTKGTKPAENSPQDLGSPSSQTGVHKSPVVERKGSITSSDDGPSRKTSLDETEVPPAMETPQSPPPGDQPPKKMSSVQVESDWSSGEEFKSCDNSDKISEETGSRSKQKEEGHEKNKPEQPVDYPVRRKQEISDNEQGDRVPGRGAARPSKHLPRRYQVEGEPQEMSRKDQYRPREPRMEKRYMVGPTSPSPPPPGFHRRRAYHASPPPDQFDRTRHHRTHPYSPGPPRGHRRHSRSPQRYQSPSYKKTPSPRPRSPISRSKDVHVPRHRYESPPSEIPRGRYLRRGSPPSPAHRHQHSMSPPYPRSPIRKRPRHRTPSLSPPRRSPVHVRKREKSPTGDSGRSSPRYTNRPNKRAPAHYSRTPSPKAKFRESGKEEKPDYKRRKIEEARPKTPPSNPLPPKGPSGHSAPQPSYVGGKQHHPHIQAGMVIESHPQQGPSHLLVGADAQVSKVGAKTQVPVPEQGQQHTDNLLDLLRRYPVMWQGHLTLKNDSAAVQLHFLSGNVQLAKMSLPQSAEQHTPTLRIAQRMRLEKTQLEGVGRRMQTESEHCLLLALPCGRDASDVHVQTNALKNSLISYLMQKQAAGIINVPTPQTGYVLHIFPPCPFSQAHLSRVAPDLLSSASDNCHLMIVVATM